MEVILMPFGKHKGKPIAEIDSNYLSWGQQTFRGPLLKAIDKEMAARSKREAAESKAKRRQRRMRNLNRDHYAWADRNGFVHQIPNDVDMAGRENEECPFDVTPEQYREELSDLDREFRAIVR